MTTAVSEKYGSPKLFSKVDPADGTKNISGAERSFIVSGTTDETDALDALNAELEATWEGLYLQSTDIQLISEANGGFWDGSAKYGEVPPGGAGASGTSVESFQISTEQIHVVKTLETYAKGRKTGGTTGMDDYGGLINVDKVGDKIEVKGADIMTPIASFTLNFSIDADNWETFRDAALVSVGTTNLTTWHGYAANCLLFTGISANKLKRSWSVQASFAYRPETSEETVNGMTIPVYPGWFYLWFRYEDEVMTGVGMVKKPVSWRVEELYYGTEFSNIGIPDLEA